MLVEADPPADVLAALRAKDEQIAAAEQVKVQVAAEVQQLQKLAAPLWVAAANEIALLPYPIREAVARETEEQLEYARREVLERVGPLLHQLAVAELAHQSVQQSYGDGSALRSVTAKILGSPPAGVTQTASRYRVTPPPPPPAPPTAPEPVLVNTVRQIR